MASGLTATRERRGTTRLRPEQTLWQPLALLRPGQEILLLNVSQGGALVESASRMTPGARTELQLFGLHRRLVRGRIDRCRISRLEPLCYEGAIVFDQALELA